MNNVILLYLKRVLNNLVDLTGGQQRTEQSDNPPKQCIDIIFKFG